MSLISHRRHSIDFLDYLIRRFNATIGRHFIKINVNTLEMTFPKRLQSDGKIIVSLFTKLATSFDHIKRKYLFDSEKMNRVQLTINEDNEYYKIQLKGILYIPPGKILKLLGLILWYYIRYETGTKPSSSNKGKIQYDKWKTEEKLIHFEISRISKKQFSEYVNAPCDICGDESHLINKWKFKKNRKNIGLEMDTRVCSKHKNQLI